MEAVESDSQSRGFCVRLSHLCTAQRPTARGVNGPQIPSVCLPSFVPWHCSASAWRKRIFDFCKTALVSWPNLYLPLSLSAKLALFLILTKPLYQLVALCSELSSLPPWTVTSTLQPKKCLVTLVTRIKGFSTGQNTIPEHVLVTLERLFFSHPPFLGKNSRRTSEKETGLLKSRNTAGCISKIKSLLKKLLAWPSLWMEHSWAKWPFFWSLNTVRKREVGFYDQTGLAAGIGERGKLLLEKVNMAWAGTP